MTDAKYFFRRDKTWWVKIAVPRTLRDTLGCGLRRSLYTHDLDVARAARDGIVAELRQEIAEVRVPMLVNAAQPGQFVVAISNERGERIPLIVVDFDRAKPESISDDSRTQVQIFFALSDSSARHRKINDTG